MTLFEYVPDRTSKIPPSDDIIEMRNSVEQVYRNDEIFDYIARLVKATRENDFIRVGVSPRGALAISNMAAACAYLHRRDYVVPEDVKSVFTDVCAHRIVLTPQARMSAIRSDDICKEIVKTVAAPTIRS